MYRTIANSIGTHLYYITIYIYRYSHILYHILHTRILCEYRHCITFYVHILCCIVCTQIVSHFLVCCRAECRFSYSWDYVYVKHAIRWTLQIFYAVRACARPKGDLRTEVFCPSNDPCGSTQLGQVNTVCPETCTAVCRGPTIPCVLYLVSTILVSNISLLGDFFERLREVVESGY